jgi:hypothetical protein
MILWKSETHRDGHRPMGTRGHERWNFGGKKFVVCGTIVMDIGLCELVKTHRATDHKKHDLFCMQFEKLSQDVGPSRMEYCPGQLTLTISQRCDTIPINWWEKELTCVTSEKTF